MTPEMPDGFRPDDPTAHVRADHSYAECDDIRVSEHSPGKGEPDATPWIMINLDLAKLGVSGTEGGFLGLEFKRGVSLTEAEQLAHQLYRMVVGVSCTKFIS